MLLLLSIVLYISGNGIRGWSSSSSLALVASGGQKGPGNLYMRRSRVMCTHTRVNIKHFFETNDGRGLIGVK